MSETPDFGTVLDARAARSGQKQRGPVPAEVVSYSRTTQRAEVRPLVHPQGQALPKVLDVPVWFPGGGGYTIVWDLAAGDEVLLVVCEVDGSAWKARGVSGEAPTTRRYDLADAVAIPHTKDLSAGAAGALVLDGSDIRLGSAAALDPVVLATANESNWTLYDAWAVTVQSILAGLGIPVAPPWTPPHSNTAATKVTAE